MRDKSASRRLAPRPVFTRRLRKRVLSGQKAPYFGLFLALAALVRPGAATAQEAIRQSLAGEEAAAERRRAAATLDYYNLKLGPTAWNFDAGLSFEASDNIRYTSEALSDVALRPELGMRVVWPVSDQNSLNLSVGAGYEAYLQHSEYDYYFIRPGSELSFDLYTGDFWINLHDRFSIVQDNYQDPTVVGAANQSRLENSLGLSTVWDLDKVIVRSGFDHVSYMSIGSADQNYYQAPDGQSEVFSASVGYLFRPELQAGVELGASLINYDSQLVVYQPYTEAMQYNFGGFVDSRLSEYLKVRASAGYMIFDPDFLPGFESAGDFSGFYAQLDLTHRLNDTMDYTVSAGRQVNFTFYGGSVDLYFARWMANWKVFEKTTLSTGLTYEHGSQLYQYEEKFDRVGPTISLGRKLTEKLSASLTYQYYWRNSDVANRDYTVNMVTLGFKYRF